MCETSQAHPMTNTHLLQTKFTYLEPATLAEALALLQRHHGRAKLIAGGTYLLVQMKQEHKAPPVVINIEKVPGLRDIAWDRDKLSIGALARIRQVGTDAEILSNYQTLVESCSSFGSMQIQMMGSIGGNVCNGSPASDAVPALLALEAELALVSAEGRRVLPLADFLLGPGKTAIRPDEVLTHLLLPKPQANTGSAFIKVGRVEADLAKVSVAAVIVRQGDQVVDCKLAFGSVAPTVIRATAAEKLLKGKPFDPQLALAAGEVAMDEVSPIDDVRSNAWYRRKIVKAIAHDVLVAAWERAGNPAPTASPGANSVHPAPAARNDNLSVEPDEQVLIELTVNGETHRVWVAPNELLLNVLREKLAYTGPKYGCGIGECGACTVLLDGRPALSCLTLAIAADGREVLTVEGLQAQDGALHPLQEAFLDHQAFQCGYCTPGILMMSKALLDDLPSANEDNVREYLRGNRCRCTGFVSITRAVLSQVTDGELL